MLVAIIDQTTPSGKVKVREVRQGVSEAAVITAFVADYTPPLTPGDWLGYDTGWGSYQYPAAGKFWAYDFDTPGLVQEDLPIIPIFHASSMLRSDELAITATSPSWDTVGGVIANPQFFIPTLGDILGTTVAEAKCVDGPVELRLFENGVGISAIFSLADTADVWANFSFDTTSDPATGRNRYELGARLGAGTTSATVRYASLLIMEKTT